VSPTFQSECTRVSLRSKTKVYTCCSLGRRSGSSFSDEGREKLWPERKEGGKSALKKHCKHLDLRKAWTSNSTQENSLLDNLKTAEQRPTTMLRMVVALLGSAARCSGEPPGTARPM
jgi:hypothetical protein